MKSESQKQTTKEIKHKGLTSEEVLASREKHGSNKLSEAEKIPWWKLYLEKFNDPIIRILLVAAVISLFVGIAEGSFIEPIGIIAAVLLSTTIGFLNEFKAAKEFDILNQVADEAEVNVIRNGLYAVVPIKDLVVGDIVLLQTGEEVPADGKLLESISLQIDESKLTGESAPVSKHSADSPHYKEKSDLAYPLDAVLRSTMIVDGHGIMRIEHVGDSTEIGRATISAIEDSGVETPLNKQLNALGKAIGAAGAFAAFMTFLILVATDKTVSITHNYQWIAASIALMSCIIALAKIWVPIVKDALEVFGYDWKIGEIFTDNKVSSWLRMFVYAGIFLILSAMILVALGLLPKNPAGTVDPGDEWIPKDALKDFLQFFMISVAIIVMAVPEGLPMSITLSLAYSMRRMTAANNLVRRMHACETIGASTVICSDKTGTLTRNKMLVNKMFFGASGKETTKLSDDLKKLAAEAIAANSTANLGKDKDGEETALGNPTEGALILWLKDLGIDYSPIRDNFKIIKQWTFSTERKMMGTYGISKIDGKEILYVKGAPEFLIDKASFILGENGSKENFTDEKKNEIRKLLQEQQNRGMRTLALLCKREKISDLEAEISEKAHDLVWLGFAVIADPVREDVPDALQTCKKAGIRVKIITGDTSNTAWEIGRQIGLITDCDSKEKCHITGSEFQAMPEDEAIKIVEDIKIISRARPNDKLKMVKLLQKLGHVVAVTGDGTNDAPALNHADVGVSMGKTGTSVAKEASDIILLDDSFPSLVKGVSWGRSLYENIQRFLTFQLTINFVAVAIAVTGPFIGVELPLTVTQILWINIIMDTFAALALAAEQPHPEVMDKAPRKPDSFIITKPMAKNILITGIIFYIVLVYVLRYSKQLIAADSAQTLHLQTTFFTFFVLMQAWNLFNARALNLKGSALSGICQNKSFLAVFALILAGQFLIVQFGGKIFRTTPLDGKTWGILLALSSFVLIGGELMRLANTYLIPVKKKPAQK